MWNTLHFFGSKFAVNHSNLSNVIAMLLFLLFLCTKESENHSRKKKSAAFKSGIKKHLDIVKCIILCTLTPSCHTF